MTVAERIAREFHDAYEEIAAEEGWETQHRSRTSWDDLPPENKRTMIRTVERLLQKFVIVPGAHTVARQVEVRP